MKKLCWRFIAILCSLIMASSVIFYSSAKAQNLWQAIPPYNVLWPLWSPALSPPDATTGVPTPLVTTLTKKTVLPVQPAIVWDPAMPYFYLLYNSTYGLKYYDLFDKSFPYWPPLYLTTYTATGSLVPKPIPLPSNYSTLISFDPALWINTWVPVVNADWLYYNSTAVLVTPADLLSPSYIFTAYYLPPPVPVI